MVQRHRAQRTAETSRTDLVELLRERRALGQLHHPRAGLRSGLSEKEVREMESPEREDQLWQILDQKPFLLVLDGLERILLAYARMDAAQMLDAISTRKLLTKKECSPAFRKTFANLPPKARLRQCIDANAARFLRRLTKIRASRILITTRLYPAELQTNTAQPWPACSRCS